MATDTDSMFSAYGSIFDATTADNVGVRDRALSVAQLQPGRATVYGAHQAGGMLMQNLAGMAGMKTAEQQKSETITNIMKESAGLDPSNPQSARLLAQKFIQAGLPGIGQKFLDKARTMTVSDRTYGLDVRKTEATEKQVDILGAAEDRASYEFGKTMEFKLKEFDHLVYKFDETHSQAKLVQAYKEKQDAILNEFKTEDMSRDDGYLVLALNELNFKEAQAKLDVEHRADVLTAQEMRDAVDKIYKEKMAAAAEVTAEARATTAESAGVLTENEQAILDRKKRNEKAVEIRATWGPTHTVEEKQALLDHLEKLGVADSTVYTTLQASHSTQRSSELSADKFDVSQESSDLARLKAEQDNSYKPVVYGTNDGDMMAAGFLREAGSDMGETEEKTMSGIMGAEIKSYDLALNAERQLDDDGIAEGVTPTEARLGGYYERALAFPEVYKTGEWSFKQEAAFDSLLFKKVLNKSFSRGGAQVEWAERGDFVRAGLIVPNKTVLIGEDGMVGTVTEEVLTFMINKYNK